MQVRQLLIAIVVSNTLYGCGSKPGNIVEVGGGDNPVPSISVQLNDLFQQAFPSESVSVVDSRYFTPPTSVSVVGGSYAGGNPGQFLRARIIINNDVCEYQSSGINDYSLVLQSCTNGTGSVKLPEDSYIELRNYDAPGYLLEVHFNLTR